MKMIRLIFPLFILLSVCFTNKADAQIIDSLPYFKLDPLVLGDLDLKATYIIPKASMGQLKAISSSVAKKIGVPAAITKVIKGPIVLKLGDKCVKVGCKKGDCSTCKMVWKDLNKDGKIQPKKELRCICPDSKELCKLVGKKVDCK